MVELIGASLCVLEKDCKMMVDDVNKDKSNHLEYGVILSDYKTLPMNHNNYKVVLSRRQKNRSVHALTRTKEVALNNQRTKFGDILCRMHNVIRQYSYKK